MIIGDIDKMKKNKNAVQKEVGIKKKAGQECDAMVAEVKALGETIEKMEKEQDETKTLLDSLLGKIGTEFYFFVSIVIHKCNCGIPSSRQHCRRLRSNQ